jgi:hypothetical protein
MNYCQHCQRQYAGNAIGTPAHGVGGWNLRDKFRR